MTYKQTLSNFRKILSNDWNLLGIKNGLKHIFNRQNKNLTVKIGGTNIENNKVVRKQKPILKIWPL